MRMFPVPMDLTEEEKTVGGFLSIRQVVYLLGAVASAALFYVVFSTLGAPLWLRVPAAVLLVIAGIYLAFGRPSDVPADRYLVMWVQYRRREKEFCWRGDE